MPAKYSHVKKRSALGLLKKTGNGHVKDIPHHHAARSPNPHTDRSITKAMSAVSQLERGIARILLLRYEQDIARLFSTRLYSVALVHLPTFVMRCMSLAGPSWLVHNHDCEEIKDFFRAAISMDMRQAGERVATKSVLWSYTALRHFALSNGVPICAKRGLHSLRLLEYYPALRAHIDALEAMPPPTFSKPPHLGSLQEGREALEDACELKFRLSNDQGMGGWDKDWRAKVHLGYERLSQTLWKVAREFDVRGYGKVLREKLTSKWCDCGCSTDHLGEVCERTVREEEEENGVRVGKQREWDGRGSGVYGWETEEEEDIWEIELDFGGMDPEGSEHGADSEMTIGEIMEWRFFKAEREKEEGDFKKAVRHYEVAHDIEPELPHYQLNLAAAHLKLSNWMEAEKACTKALSQHRSSKGYYRRARARRMLNRPDEAIKDLRAVLKLQPTNAEAIAELASLLPPDRPSPKPNIKQSNTPSPGSSSSAPIPPSSSTSSSGTKKSGSGAEPTKRTEQSKQPPWPRTKADERRLKVVLIPASAAEKAFEEYGRQYAREAAAASGCAHPHHGNGNGKNKGKAAAGTAKTGTGKRPNGDARSKNGRIREMKEIMRAETVVYPSWDRYVVKKAD
ncbi:putative tetratricopeptide repeats [Lyophyllum shimeji]|uniref:Tetratricopeptide repeats n=1 Tax=Lyophyllum shimeji TaxID=47721 RepID=A0A9P3Q130_LYOSH|nr:putative tetratricopeptide repeats [Lyophyllum shimeji]